MFRSKSHNRMILHKLMRKGRRKNLPLNMRYYVLYAFLYKYMSDKLKNHLMYYLSGDEADLNMLYLTGEGTDDLRQWALNDMGYFFTSQSASARTIRQKTILTKSLKSWRISLISQAFTAMRI